MKFCIGNFVKVEPLLLLQKTTIIGQYLPTVTFFISC